MFGADSRPRLHTAVGNRIVFAARAAAAAAVTHQHSYLWHAYRTRSTMRSDLSDRDSIEQHNNVTFVSEALKRQLVQSAGIVYHRALDRIERAASLSGLTKPGRKHAQIIEQSRIICEDYIYCRLQVDIIIFTAYKYTFAIYSYIGRHCELQ